MPPQSHAETLTGEVKLKEIEAHIEHDKKSKSARFMNLVSSAQDKISKANDAINKAEDVASPWDVSKVAVADLLAPVRDIIEILDCVAEIHPAVKVVAGVVKVVIDFELTRRSNDKQIAVIYFTMSSLLLLLSDLDAVFDDDNKLKTCLDAMCKTINSFGNFCEVYYRHSGFVKTLKSKHYKDKLAAYASDFDGHKKELHLLLSAQSTLVIIDVRTEVTKIVALLEAKSVEEQTADRYVDSMGGLDAVIQDDVKLEQLARVLGEKFDSSMRRILRTDLDDILRHNLDAFSNKIDIMVERIEASNEASTEIVMYKMDVVTTKVLDQMNDSTLVILHKLEDGPHNLIEDHDLRLVWQTMQGRASVDRHMFLDALCQHFQKKFAAHLASTHEEHPDAWTVHFLSRPYFRPAIGDGIDDDCSGFISHTEINTFVRSKPRELGCSTIAWIAFWAVGPYKCDVDYLRRIRILRARLKREPQKVLPQNRRRTKHLTSMLPRLKLIEVLDGILRPLGEQEENHAEYGALDRLRRLWLDLQQKRIRANLDKLKYQIKGADYVSVVLDGQRLENCILCMIHLLLMRHMKVLRAARTKLVAVREFEDMLDSWNYVFEAFSQRLGVLVQTWRQQRLDLDSQVQYFSRGLFKGWFEREQSIFQMDYVNHFNAEDDDQYYASSEEEDMDGPDEDEIAVGLDPSGSADSERDSGVLTYPLPAAPEDESELISGDEQDWEPEAVRKHKADLELRAEVSSISKRLTNIEDILAQLLSALQQGSGVPSSPKPDKQRMSVAQREDIVQVRRTLELCKSAFIASRDGTGTAVEQHSTKILSEVLPSLVIRITEMAARYPGLGVLNTTLKAVVGLEMARRTNNRPLTFVAVWLCMADSIFQIMVIPPEAVDSDQDEFFKSIWGEVEKLSRTVRDFAMFCDVYDQQKIAARFFKAAASKDKLAAFANRFSGHTEALRTLLSSEFDTSLTKPVFSDLEVARNLTNMS